MTKRNFTSVNEHTGSVMVTKPGTKAYSAGWDNIFGKYKMCAVCDEAVAAGHSSTYDGETYHPECLEAMFAEESSKQV